MGTVSLREKAKAAASKEKKKKKSVLKTSDVFMGDE